MGWLGALGKGLGIAGGIIGAPFTGGASLIPTIGAIAGAAAPVIGGLAAGRAQGKQVEGNQQIASSQATNNALMQQLQAKILQQKTGMNQALQGDAMANMQDVGVKWGGPGSGLRGQTVQFTGGKRPSLMSDATRQLGGAMAAQGRTMAMAPGPQMQLPQMPKDSLMDKILGIAGPAAGFAGLLGNIPKKPGMAGGAMGGGATPPFVPYQKPPFQGWA